MWCPFISSLTRPEMGVEAAANEAKNNLAQEAKPAPP